VSVGLARIAGDLLREADQVAQRLVTELAERVRGR